MAENLHALTGAYVLDALDADETAAFEAHLAGCAECREEVASLRETAAFLGRAEAQSPPPALRRRVLDAITTTTQERGPQPSPAPELPFRRRFGWRRPLAAAAAVIMVGGLAAGGAVVYRDHRSDQQAVAAEAQMMRIATAPDAVSHPVELGTSHVVMSLAMSAAALVGEHVPAPPDRGMVYQVWMVHGDGSTAAGPTFTPDDGDVLAIVKGDLSTVSELMVTEEPDGGSPAPTGPKVAVVAL